MGFQSLIGRLQTVFWVDGVKLYLEFQSLIGRLQTVFLGEAKTSLSLVSIPHR